MTNIPWIQISSWFARNSAWPLDLKQRLTTTERLGLDPITQAWLGMRVYDIDFDLWFQLIWPDPSSPSDWQALSITTTIPTTNMEPVWESSWVPQPVNMWITADPQWVFSPSLNRMLNNGEIATSTVTLIPNTSYYVNKNWLATPNDSTTWIHLWRALSSDKFQVNVYKEKWNMFNPLRNQGNTLYSSWVVNGLVISRKTWNKFYYHRSTWRTDFVNLDDTIVAWLIAGTQTSTGLTFLPWLSDDHDQYRVAGTSAWQNRIWVFDSIDGSSIINFMLTWNPRITQIYYDEHSKLMFAMGTSNTTMYVFNPEVIALNQTPIATITMPVGNPAYITWNRKWVVAVSYLTANQVVFIDTDNLTTKSISMSPSFFCQQIDYHEEKDVFVTIWQNSWEIQEIDYRSMRLLPLYWAGTWWWYWVFVHQWFWTVIKWQTLNSRWLWFSKYSNSFSWFFLTWNAGAWYGSYSPKNNACYMLNLNAWTVSKLV